MAFSAGHRSGAKSEINVTPLVDVVLVLLIIFMVVTPMLRQGIEVQLPLGPHAERKPGEEDDLIISIKRDGTVFVAQSWIADADLQDYLVEHKGSGNRTVMLKADALVAFGRVREVMKAVNDAGMSKVAVLTEQRTGLE